MVKKDSNDRRLIELYKRQHYIALFAVILVILSFWRSNGFFSFIDTIFFSGFALIIFVLWLQYWIKFNFPDIEFDYQDAIDNKYPNLRKRIIIGFVWFPLILILYSISSESPNIDFIFVAMTCTMLLLGLGGTTLAIREM